MKVLVTGATGFVGGHLVDQLLARGDTITALVRSPARAAELAARGVRLVTGDLSDHLALADASAGQEVIYHAAALTGAVDEAEFMLANREGTANVVRAALAVQPAPRLVLISSGAAGGPSRRGQPKTAAGPDTPVTMYGRSKLAGEQAVRGQELPWTILRPPTVYGPRDKDNLLTVFKAAQFGLAPVFGDGSMELSAIHVHDLADAIIRAGTSPDVIGQVYYVNHPEVLNSAALVQTIGRTLGREVTLLPLPRWLASSALTATELWAGVTNSKTILRADKANEFYAEAWTGDPTPFMTATGWVPRYDFASGAADTAAWYYDSGWLKR